ncbi:phosphoglucosamine mutase [Desulfuromusa kysingii]|uniref:Phosphoglucosamine mutase n=1 Tax=Desulfuromusa kysingii TaxID=37625 RepID=A0A1H3WXD3_9BACT|nr:phosphoglucosamine mutase [Desulfuromusa kysingii]SDZ91826.1 phosphoglucosamine mutase [Desulfuromusa kysingii]
MDKKLFGTDGVRGVANIDPMTTEMAMQLGRAAAFVFKNGGKRRHRVVIGKDTRLSGYMIENALVAGICSMGVDVLIVGPLPTPGIAFLTSSMRADAGVVISASHNPYQDNGIKFFSSTGYKLQDELELKIEDLIINHRLDELRPIADEVGKAYRISDAIGRYIVFLKNTFPKDLDLEGVRIVLDCAHGAGYKVAPAVLTELGAEVIPLGVNPNGMNINDGCGSMHPEVMAEKVCEYRADLGIALDGDADRVIFVDEKGRTVDGDHIMALCGTEMIKAGKLKNKTVVATVMSNMGLEIAIKKAGGQLVRTAVGDRYVVEEMLKEGYNLGGEQSGHMIFLDHNTTGDGILSALQVLAIIKRSGEKLSELAKVMTSLPQVLVNVKVRKKAELRKIKPIKEVIDTIEAELGESGRLLVRYSGTEALLRVMIEGENQSQIESLAHKLAAVVQEHLGA